MPKVPKKKSQDVRKRRFATDLALSALTISMVYKVSHDKIKKALKYTFSAYPLAVFAQAICSGYEATMADLALSLPEPANVDTPRDTLLIRTQENIRKYIFSVDGLKENFWEPFKTSLLKREAKIRKLDEEQSLTSTEAEEDRFARELLTDKELSYDSISFFASFDSFESPEMINRIDRSIRMATSTEKSSFLRFLEYAMKMKFAAVSASVSTMLVNIDRLGRGIGSSLAVISKFSFGRKFSEKISQDMLPALMSLVFVTKEIVDIAAEYSIGLIHKGLFFPMCSGVAAGMYETFRVENPDFFAANEKLAKPLAKLPGLEGIVKACAAEAENHYYKRYEDKFKDEAGKKRERKDVTYDFVTKSYKKSKKLLECRQAFYSICQDKGSFGSLAKFTRFCLIASRFWLLTLQTFIARDVFAVSKVATHQFSKYMNTLLSSPQVEPKEQELREDVDIELKDITPEEIEDAKSQTR